MPRAKDKTAQTICSLLTLARQDLNDKHVWISDRIPLPDRHASVESARLRDLCADLQSFLEMLVTRSLPTPNAQPPTPHNPAALLADVQDLARMYAIYRQLWPTL